MIFLNNILVSAFICHLQQGYGRAAAELAVRILKTAAPDVPIKLSTEWDNEKAQRLYQSVGFLKTEEMDGDYYVFRL